MKFLILFLLCSLNVFAQDLDKKNATDQSIYSMWSVQETKPISIHDFAMDRFKALQDYQKLKGWTFGNVFSLRYMSGGKDQELNVGLDGKVDFTNMTTEDGLLLMIASEINRELEQNKEWDREEKIREEERKANPPMSLRFGKETYDLNPVKELPGDTLAITYCNFKNIDYLIEQARKRSSILHEMMHVATNCDGSKTLHSAIYELAPPLLQLMQDNPETMDYLLKREPATSPKVVSAHIVLNSVQAKEQGYPVPVCTPESTTTCYDPTLPNIVGHTYSVKENCEKGEGVKCTEYAGVWMPIGKPVFEDQSEGK